MSYQPPQRPFLPWVALLVALMVLVMLVAVPVVLAARHYQRGVEGRCAVHFESDKPDLAAYRWSWWWLPGWCASSNGMGDGGSGVSGKWRNTPRSMA
jgi:hypothetical protein